VSPRSKSKKTLAGLGDLEVQLAEERRRLARVGHEERTAIEGVAAAREALVAAIASDKPERTAQRALEAAEARTREPWQERRSAAQRRVLVAEAAVVRFITDNLGAISAEVRPDADQAKADLEQALAGVLDAIKAWEGISSRWDVLLATIGAGASRPVPLLGLERVRGEVRAALEGDLPAPMPREEYEAAAPKQRPARVVTT